MNRQFPVDSPLAPLTSRRHFLRLLGLSSAALAALPLEELTDRLGFALSPTRSVYVRRPQTITRIAYCTSLGSHRVIRAYRVDPVTGLHVFIGEQIRPNLDWGSPNHAEGQRRRMAMLDDAARIRTR